jgi:hypothetical protein
LRGCEESLLLLPPLWAAEGGEGWHHALLAVVGWMSKKGIGQGKKKGGIESFYLMLSYIVIVFCLIFFNGWLPKLV